jgi:hypothetical protein
MAGARGGDGGDYWKGPFYRLEAEGFDCVLAAPEARPRNARGEPPQSPRQKA